MVGRSILIIPGRFYSRCALAHWGHGNERSWGLGFRFGFRLGDVSNTLTDPAEEKIAQMVADGRLAAPPMSRNNPRNLRIIARADELKKEEGGLDATMFPTRQAAVKFFTTGKGADAFRQQETILHHQTYC